MPKTKFIYFFFLINITPTMLIILLIQLTTNCRRKDINRMINYSKAHGKEKKNDKKIKYREIKKNGNKCNPCYRMNNRSYE